MTTAQNARQKRWRLQFGLRALFGLVTVAAALLAAGVYLHHRLCAQWRAVDEIERAVDAENRRLARIAECSAYPQPDISATTAPKRWFGQDLSRLHPHYVDVTRLAALGEVPVPLATRNLGRFCKLATLRLEAASLTDRELGPLSQLAELEELEVRSESLDGTFLSSFPADAPLVKLSLRSKRLRDEGLIAACRLPSLTNLSLMELRLESPATLAELKRLDWLQSLNLGGEFSLAEARVLSDLRQLHSLHLSPGDRGIDDETFAQLCRCEGISDLQLLELKLEQPQSLRRLALLPRLFSLGLHGTFPNDGLEALVSLEALEFVTLANPTLNNDGIRRVAQSPTIYSLTIESENVDGGVLDDLAAMPSLRSLTLWGTRISRQEVARLRAMRPDIDVARYPRD